MIRDFFNNSNFSFLMNSIKDLIVYLSLDGKILFINDAFGNFVCNKGSKLIGKHFRDLLDTLHLDILVTKDIADIIPNLPIVDLEYNCRDSHNNIHDVLWSFLPLLNEKQLPDGLILIGRDITEHKKLSAQIERLDNIIRYAPDWIYWKDRNSIHLGCNEQFSKAAGLKFREDIIGKTDEDLPWRENAQKYNLDDKEVIGSGIPKINIEDTVPLQNGKKAIVISNKVPLRDSNGQVIGVLGIATEITNRKRMEEDLHKSKEAAESANRAKTEFIANMSHDIRTPLNGVIGIANILKRQGISEEDREHGQMIYDASKQLLQLLNSVLDVVSTGHMNEDDIIAENFNLKLLLSRLFNLMHPSTEAKGIQLNFELDPELPLYVISDRLKIERILQNLLGNAIKFTSEGEVKLAVKVLSVEHGKAEIKFNISDTGMGIPEEQQHQVFDRFFRATPSFEGVYQGHGVGLYIVKKFITLLGSQVDFHSEANKGTTFSFSLKLKLGEEASLEQQKTTLPHPNKIDPEDGCTNNAANASILSKLNALNPSLRILFIEDNAIARHTGKKILENLGHQVQVAEDAENGLVLAKSHPYDLILSDLGLPGMQGDEMTIILRRWEKASQKLPTPIFALTAHADNQIKENCIEAGINQVFIKPLDDTLLKNILLELIACKKNISPDDEVIEIDMKEGLGQDLPMTEEELFQLEGFPIFDLKDGISKTSGESLLNEALELTLKEILPQELSNLQAAYSENNWELIRQIAHKLKGGTVYCGTIRMTMACQYIERYHKAGHRKLLEKLYQQLISTIEETRQTIKHQLLK